MVGLSRWTGGTGRDGRVRWLGEREREKDRQKGCHTEQQLIGIRFVLVDIAEERVQVLMALLGIIASDNLSRYTDDSRRLNAEQK